MDLPHGQQTRDGSGDPNDTSRVACTPLWGEEIDHPMLQLTGDRHYDAGGCLKNAQ
ncbi:MAG TPA: hypothetical protein VKF36_25755 [Syntrophorhabdales bacterium]|nr:hypothetical protein [Syntrophorhabdales bacterium]